MEKLKIVVDTNVLVSAVGWDKGNERQIIDKCAEGKLQLVVSKDLLDEFEEVIFRPKFDFIPHWKKPEFLTLLTEISTILSPGIVLKIINEDEGDNRVLECAVAGEVDYIISGDKHLLNLSNIGNIKILRPSQFLSLEG